MNNTIMLPSMIILGVYFGLCLMLGWYSKRRSEGASTREFLTANEGVGWLVNGVAMFAAFSSGGALLGNMGLGYAHGWGYLVTLNTGTSCSMLLAAFLVAKPMRNMRLATVPEFLKIRYDSKPLRIFVPTLLIICMTIYMVAQMKITGMLGEEILGVPYIAGIFIVGSIYVFYTAVGGMWAISLTDFFQGTIMMLMLFIATAICFEHLNGPVDLYKSAQSVSLEWTQIQVPLISFVGGFLVWCCVQPCLPHTIMRVLSSKNEREGRSAFGIGIGLIALSVVLTAIFITGSSIVLNDAKPLANGDAVFITVINTWFPTWIRAFTYCAIFAAVMSSISGMLLSIGAAVSYDLMKTLKPEMTDKSVRKLSTVSVLVIGVISMILAINPPAFVLVLFSSAMGLLGSGLFWPIILGLWWKRMNKYGALAGMVGGVTVYAFAYFAMDLPLLSHICFSLPISLVLCVAVSLFTPPSSDAEMERLTIAHEREYQFAEGEQ